MMMSKGTVRLGRVRVTKDRYAVLFTCTTMLAETFRQDYADVFAFSGNRAILFPVDDLVPTDELSLCIALALRCHLDKGRDTADRSPDCCLAPIYATPPVGSPRSLSLFTYHCTEQRTAKP